MPSPPLRRSGISTPHSDKVNTKPSTRSNFRFFDLPPELRCAILEFALVRDRTIDIDTKAHGDLSRTLLVSKQFCEEAAKAFYGGNTFRILPTHHRAAGRYARPLLQDFSQWHRSRIVSLELRLGPFWANPPKCWRRGITKRMGLEQVTSLRVLKVFVEIDPSHDIFKGFRNEKIPYDKFCANLLEQVMQKLPSLEEIRFDAYASASRGMPLIDGLVDLARSHGKRVTWGPFQRAIDEESDPKGSNQDSGTTVLTDMVSTLFSQAAMAQRSLPKSFLT